MSRGLAVAFGIVVGAAAAIVGSRARDLNSPADAHQTDLDKRLHALETGSAARGRAVVPPEVQAKLHREMHAARIARHDREPIDAEWSAGTTKLIKGELDRDAADLEYKVTRLDCRSASCVVGFEWPSRSASLPAEGALVHSLSDLPCTRELLFDEPVDPSGQIAASMVLECERAAANSAK